MGKFSRGIKFRQAVYEDLSGFVLIRAENPRKSVFFCVNLRPRKSGSGNESSVFHPGYVWVDTKNLNAYLTNREIMV